MKLNEVVYKPIVTEKSAADEEALNRYHFKVAMNASKGAVAKAIEDLYGVDVEKVRTMIVPGKPKRILSKKYNRFTKTKAWKKAIVQIKKGQEINYD